MNRTADNAHTAEPGDAPVARLRGGDIRQHSARIPPSHRQADPLCTAKPLTRRDFAVLARLLLINLQQYNRPPTEPSMQALSTLAGNDAEIHDTPPGIHEPEPALPFRSDTILGVCEAIGQDFGFNPTYLRLAFAASFYANPLMVLGTYLALGAGVALARWLYPVSTPAIAQPIAQTAAPAAVNEDSQSSLAA